MVVKDLLNSWGLLLIESKEDNDVIIRLKTSLLSQSLDLVNDFSASTHKLELIILSQIEHNLNVTFTTEFLMFLDGFLVQQQFDGQELVSEFEIVNDELSILKELSGISIVETLDLLSEIVVVGLLELLAKFSMVGGDLIADKFVDFLVEQDILDVDFVLDVDKEGLEGFLVVFRVGDDSQGRDGLLEGNLSLFSEDSGFFDDGGHQLDVSFDLFVDETRVELGDSEEMDGLLVVLRVLGDGSNEVLEDHFGDKWHEG
mmetsp:Transcript_14639/g.12454  ORF Transcript_14639/g.12454 Transcript_14639/m.12454 type:complete len:258 (+) Transcript_14639:495-1268(+)